jgi:acyl carrier protein
LTETPTLEGLEKIIYDVLRGELLEVGPGFTPKSNLVDAGLSSLAVIQLLLAVEEQTGIWVDEAELTPENLESVESLARCVWEQRSG